MPRTISSLGAVILASALLLSPSIASGDQGRGRGQDKKADKGAPKAAGKAAAKENKADAREDKADAKARKSDRADHADVAIDRDGHARVIHDYVRTGPLPPGLAKRRSLPPGLARQLRERGELPPGLEKHWVAVPDPWARRLPLVPSYYHRYFAGDDLVVVDTRTNRIAYLIRDVLR